MQTSVDEIDSLKKVIDQKKTTPWFNSELRFLKQTSRKLERKCAGLKACYHTRKSFVKHSGGQ